VAKIISKRFILLASCLVAVLFAAALSTAPVFADTVYSGENIVSTTSSPTPAANAAAASFDAAASSIGTEGIITFEGDPLGSFSHLTVAPGVTINGTDLNGNNQTIRNTSNSPAFPTLDGFNTTSGGSYFVEIEAGTLTFSFATPTEFFGAYFTGIQTAFFADNITFSDGTTETIDVPGTGTSDSVGAVSFLGFTDPGKLITSVTINAGNVNTGADYIGVDDVRYQVPGVPGVPEPTSTALLLVGCAFILALAYRLRALPPVQA